jgi:hypothetical protein
MSDTGKLVILGAIAASLTIGAVQFASGHDLTGNRAVTAENAVNRSAKADRAETLPSSAGEMKTISLRLSQFSDTSFLLRIPAASAPKEVAGNAGRDRAPASQLLIKSDGAKPSMKRPVACEPSVSILTEIAKSLQPGRCVT